VSSSVDLSLSKVPKEIWCKPDRRSGTVSWNDGEWFGDEPCAGAKQAFTLVRFVRADVVDDVVASQVAKLTARDDRVRAPYVAKPTGTMFVSGHLDLTQEEFDEHYAGRIEEAHAQGFDFVVGDAAGADARAQVLLKQLGARVVVFHMHDTPRHNLGWFPTRDGFKNDRARDECMTEVSSHDIAWVRPGRERSGTANNLKRRRSRLHGSRGSK
jgi:hypothetical protein